MQKKGILLTRPLEDSLCLAQKLKKLGYIIYLQPLLTVKEISAPQYIIKDEALIFTSRHGVKFFSKHFTERSNSAWCVGKKTAAIARELGFTHVMEGDGNGETLLKRIKNKSSQQSFIHISGTDVTMDFERELHPHCKRIVLYATEPVTKFRPTIKRALERSAIGTILLYSKKTAQTLLSLCSSFDSSIKIIGLSQHIVDVFPRNPSSIYLTEDDILTALVD